MYKRILAGIGVAGILVISASVAAQPASALTAEELQTQIKELLARVAELTQQLNVLQGSTGASAGSSAAGGITGSGTITAAFAPSKHRICNILNRNLSQGTSGDDVTGLQEFLRDEGHFSANATGYFGPLTATALARWQASQGVDAVGVAGPITRDRIRIWCGSGEPGAGANARFGAEPMRGVAPLTVTFKAMVGGFTPYKYGIEFGDGTVAANIRCVENPSLPDVCGSPAVVTHTYQNNGTYTATLWQYGANAEIADSGRTALARVQIYVGDQTACTREYKPVCGKPAICDNQNVGAYPRSCDYGQTYSNRCMMEADGASLLYEGACKDTPTDPSKDLRCKAWYDGCNTCSRETPNSHAMCTLRACFTQSPAYCTAYFDQSSNQPPVISSFSGPTTLSVNQTGTWTIRASDPENGQLTYRISWGDDYAVSSNDTAAGATQAFTQATTFTHVYSAAGTYTVTIIVRDSAGKEARTSTTVRVGGVVACTTEYAPVCGIPPGCASTCSSSDNMTCFLACQIPDPQTYGNRCQLNAAGASFLYQGQCQSANVTACTQDAKLCPDGSYVGRTGPNCQFVCPTN